MVVVDARAPMSSHVSDWSYRSATYLAQDFPGLPACRAAVLSLARFASFKCGGVVKPGRRDASRLPRTGWSSVTTRPVYPARSALLIKRAVSARSLNTAGSGARQEGHGGRTPPVVWRGRRRPHGLPYSWNHFGEPFTLAATWQHTQTQTYNNSPRHLTRAGRSPHKIEQPQASGVAAAGATAHLLHRHVG